MKLRNLNEKKGSNVPKKLSILTMKKKILAISLIMTLSVVLFYAGFSSGIGGSPPASIIESGSMVSTASYTVFKDSSGTYYARNGSTGTIEFSSTNATYVFQSCHDAIDGGLISVKSGIYLFSGDLLITNEHISIVGEGLGDIPDKGTILRATSGCDKIIHMKDSRWFRMEHLTLDANDVADFCFYADNYNNSAKGEANIYLNDIFAWGIAMGKCYHTISPVKIAGSTIVTITNCVFHHGYITLNFVDCTDVWVSNCDIEMGVNAIKTENCWHIHLTSIKLADCRQEFANTDYAGTSNGAVIFFGEAEHNIEMENIIILEYMLHAIRIGPYVVGPVLMNNIKIDLQPSTVPIGTSYGIWNQGCDKVVGSNIDIWDRNETTSRINIAVYDQGDSNTWTNVNVRNCAAAWSFTGSGYRVSNWHIDGKPTENSGTATIYSSTYVDVTHGLAGAPTLILLQPKDSAPAGYYWVTNIGATTFRIYIGTAGNATFYWYAEYKP